MPTAKTGGVDSWAFAAQLRQWRRMNIIKQAALAELIGVSQPTVARWERGKDIPSTIHMKRLQDLMARTMRDDLTLDRLFISRQSAVRTFVDFDGLRTLAVSDGFRKLWPACSAIIGVPFIDHLVNESRKLYDDDDIRHAIRIGSLGLASGVSERHLDLPLDSAVRHRWHYCFRHHGARILVDVVYEPCEPDAAVGIMDLVHLETLKDL